MATKPETLFRKRAQKDIDTLPNTYDLTIQQLAKKGDPDKVLCILGHFVGLEFKASKGKATKLQAHKLEQISAAGGTAFIATPENWDHVFDQLKAIADTQPLYSKEEEE